ncbi:formate dehydrogenase accessory sulfurtransferase FdhD [Intrasporangium calvum]|uniref:Sulfur carrier protein FdhD n=1 Tax=Intrasporangium calvum (strain ATCC 23552 / DSM 43043 / JCM 3097 / NBRC 12989 / NCIMB 10167 / NRRL B-3866 / 7 KIP) TaxID=710696 RepID=E6SFE8_INTC7|nr:formate dehydrogenase accessory sulfurtransferase FdhD [Intrasporangium calvum]ADU46686.1 formate dehydrogenase subunit FdhD [Intrasporangium calvum DSM 43043]
MGRVTQRTKVTVVDVSGDRPTSRSRTDTVTVEEPLELRVGGTPLTVTMRTPGHDIELVHGFLLTEGIIRDAADVSLARYCEGAVVSGESGFEENTYNVIDVTLAPGVAQPAAELARNFFTSSSCGVCGKASIEQLRARTQWPVRDDATRWPAAVITAMPERMRSEQRSFDKTGGLHAAGLFGPGGELLAVREDVGRHNAVDKVLGWALLSGRLPATGCVLMVSGRASFELTQKALMGGVPCLAAVSAPSSLAVETASDAGMTLLGFVRGATLNVYSRGDRLRFP